MRERPILFSGPMVRAILDGKKTMTRRVIKPQPEMELDGEILPDGTGGYGWEPVLPPWSKWPYQVGDRLWVRETWQIIDGCDGPEDNPVYRADGELSYTDDEPFRWRPSIFMPRWASRIALEITAVRVERLQEITEEDARAEGIIDGGCLNCGEHEPCGCNNPQPDARDSFVWLWDSINGKTCPWSSNPWVWVISFKKQEADHD